MRRFGELAGWVSGEGERVLLLHGGPGLSFEYIDPLRDELDGFRVACYQQRGVGPSTLDGPFDLETAVADAVAVLDALEWESAWIAGHSWGGYLLVHLLLAAPDRCRGGLAIDPLGAVGDGGMAAFEAEMNARTPPGDSERAAAIDARALRGESTEEDLRESLRLYWPAYFASRERVAPFLELQSSVDAYSELLAAAQAATCELGAIRVPFGAVVGERSPMPYAEAAAPTVAAIPGAWLEVVPGAGHFPWFEVPGCVRTALTRLVH
jgi:pimeloyl-ACP methyl ester carboxylesterase